MAGIRTPIEVVIFDLGSTLIYEAGPWDGLFAEADKALWEVLHRAGVALEPRDAYGGEKTLFEVYYDQHRNDLAEPTTAAVLDELLRLRGYKLPRRTLRDAMRSMFGVTQANWRVEADAVPTLESLRSRGYRLGLISNASDDDNTQALIDKAGLRPFFEYTMSSAKFGRRKPHPAIFRDALAHFRVRPEKAIMVGDKIEADIAGAHAAGMQGIWVKKRAVEPLPDPSEVQAEAVVASLSEILPLLGTV